MTESQIARSVFEPSYKARILNIDFLGRQAFLAYRDKAMQASYFAFLFILVLCWIKLSLLNIDKTVRLGRIRSFNNFFFFLLIFYVGR